MLASVGLVCAGSIHVLATLPICAIIFGAIQHFYLKTSRQMRLLDIEAKAPLFSQFLETIQGASSIRSYGWCDAYTDHHTEKLNASQTPFYLMGCLQRWLVLVLDLFNAGLAILLVTFALTIPGSSTSIFGAALYNVSTFSSALESLITEWTHVEVALGAINRVETYAADTPNENKENEKECVPKDWPSRGDISIRDLSASYSPALGRVLDEVNLDIRAGEKVAICGRSGRYVNFPKSL